MMYFSDKMDGSLNLSVIEEGNDGNLVTQQQQSEILGKNEVESTVISEKGSLELRRIHMCSSKGT